MAFKRNVGVETDSLLVFDHFHYLFAIAHALERFGRADQSQFVFLFFDLVMQSAPEEIERETANRDRNMAALNLLNSRPEEVFGKDETKPDVNH